MAVIDFPADAPRSMQWKLEQPAQQNISAWTGARQVQASGRGWWLCNFSLPPVVTTEEFNKWRSFTAKARGGANEFKVPVDPTPQIGGGPIEAGATLDIDFITRSYYSGGLADALDTPVLDTNATGRTAVARDWPPGAEIKAGHFITINDQLLQLTEDAVVDGATNTVTLTFEPPLRAKAYEGQPIEVRNPYALMYLKEVPFYTVEPGYVYNVAFEFQEAF